MNYFANMKVLHKLAWLVSIPICGLLWFSLSGFSSAWTQYKQSDNMLTLSEMLVLSSNMVHELQKERGMSAGYLGSNGQSFADALPKQRKNTDQAIKNLKSYLSEFNADAYGSAFTSDVQKGISNLNKINSVRGDISALSLSLKEGIGYYTGLNKTFLGLTNYLPQSSFTADMARNSAAYYAFIQSKERAGIERAVLANVFAKDQFAPGLYDKFKSLVVTQDVYLDVFKARATQDQINFYTQKTSHSSIAETQRYRAAAIEKANTGNFGVAPSDWFKAQTQKINLLKEIEDQLANELKAFALAAKSSAGTALWFSSLPIALICGLLALAFVLSRSIIVPLETIRNIMSKVNETGNFSLRADVKQSDEIGECGRTFNTLLSGLEQAIGETNTVIKGIAKGDFKQRVTLPLNGDLDTLKRNINESAEAIELSLNGIRESMSALSDGKFDQHIEAELAGEFKVIGDYVNGSLQSVGDTVNGLNTAIRSMADGNFNTKLDCELKGDFKKLGDHLEHSLSSVDEALNNINDVMSAIAEGTLNRRVDGQFSGQLEAMKDNINSSLNVIENVLNNVTGVLAATTSGNLSVRVDGSYQGIYKTLQDDTNSMVNKLTTVIGEIQQSANAVSSGAEDIASGNNNLSTRTEQQAANLEQTAASIEEITSTVQHTAENAHRANDLAVKAREQAERGGSVVKEAVSAMGEINEASDKIAEIIGVIDEIAFQTNLLALNASVEAARAGEQGKGFAVVASEVRNLAGRSATAAKEIKELIEDSASKVEAGAKLVNKSGTTLAEIVSDVKDVTQIVGEITTAAEEQSIGIAEVNRAVGELQTLTQQNTAMVEEAAAASEDLGSQARGMNSLIDFFSTSEKSEQTAPTPTPAIPAPMVERRKADRPWGNTEKTAAPVANAASQDFEIDEWEEF